MYIWPTIDELRLRLQVDVWRKARAEQGDQLSGYNWLSSEFRERLREHWDWRRDAGFERDN